MSRTVALVASTLALLAIIAGFAVYESIAFGWHFAREEVPGNGLWFWARTAILAGVSLALATSLARFPITDPERAMIGRRAGIGAQVVALLAVGATLLLLADPHLYQRVGAEDSAIEWWTALGLFAACGFMVLRLLRLLREEKGRAWHWVHVLLAAGFVALFFVMGMEEVSWFQRQIGFATPEGVAARNWQGEFNFHNFHTDITEYALYSATAFFLMLLPLVRERLAHWRIVEPVRPLLPDRTVAAISAPMLVFTYSHWNLPPVQAGFWIGLFACILFASSAATRGERRMWHLLAALVALGQLAHLLFGHRMLAIYDSTEYRELFFTFGLAAYGWRQWRHGGA